MSKHNNACAVEEAKRLEEMRGKFGLTAQSLSAAEIASDSTPVIIGFLTSLASQRITANVPDERRVHVAILSVSASILVFAFVRLFIDYTSLTLWRLSADFETIVLRFLKFLCSVMLVLTSHFLTDLLFVELNSNLSWIEAFAVVVSGIFTIYFVLQLFHLSAGAD